MIFEEFIQTSKNLVTTELARSGIWRVSLNVTYSIYTEQNHFCEIKANYVDHDGAKICKVFKTSYSIDDCVFALNGKKFNVKKNLQDVVDSIRFFTSKQLSHLRSAIDEEINVRSGCL